MLTSEFLLLAYFKYREWIGTLRLILIWVIVVFYLVFFTRFKFAPASISVLFHCFICTGPGSEGESSGTPSSMLTLEVDSGSLLTLAIQDCYRTMDSGKTAMPLVLVNLFRSTFPRWVGVCVHMLVSLGEASSGEVKECVKRKWEMGVMLCFYGTKEWIGSSSNVGRK